MPSATRPIATRAGRSWHAPHRFFPCRLLLFFFAIGALFLLTPCFCDESSTSASAPLASSESPPGEHAPAVYEVPPDLASECQSTVAASLTGSSSFSGLAATSTKSAKVVFGRAPTKRRKSLKSKRVAKKDPTVVKEPRKWHVPSRKKKAAIICASILLSTAAICGTLAGAVAIKRSLDRAPATKYAHMEWYFVNGPFREAWKNQVLDKNGLDSAWEINPNPGMATAILALHHRLGGSLKFWNTYLINAGIQVDMQRRDSRCYEEMDPKFWDKINELPTLLARKVYGSKTSNKCFQWALSALIVSGGDVKKAEEQLRFWDRFPHLRPTRLPNIKNDAILEEERALARMLPTTRQEMKA
eukprot:GHVT01086668.1.p1 GENE.GHVT01086668.1~~GHVT01086668.1.p1  ORF type:complete len:358 (-),score=42.67 GHVT01086668.1:486-1559(-)